MPDDETGQPPGALPWPLSDRDRITRLEVQRIADHEQMVRFETDVRRALDEGKTEFKSINAKLDCLIAREAQASGAFAVWRWLGDNLGKLFWIAAAGVAGWLVRHFDFISNYGGK